jgi:hypothetical protein
MNIRSNINIGKIMNNKRTKLYKYAEVIINAKLDSKAKSLLWFYAYVYNWEEGKPSYWSQRRICASVGMSSSTYQAKRKYLEELGWIKVQHRGFETPCKVSVDIGIDDPNYETKSWAQWHPSNIAILPEEAEDNFDDFSINDKLNNLKLLESNPPVSRDIRSKEEIQRFDNAMEWFG